MTSDLVHVITRTKDRPQLLVRAIESVLNQTHPNFKHIIVNDGGDLKPFKSLVANYQSRYAGRLEVIVNPQSLGAARALNVGVRVAGPDYIAVHDDDDSWDPRFLERALIELKKRQESIPITRGIATLCTLVREEIRDGRIIEHYRYSFNGWLRDVRIARMCVNNVIPPISFLFEHGALEEVGLFDETLDFAEDWDFYLRFLCRFEIAVLREHLAFYHQRRASRAAYGNTVTGAVDRHAAHGAMIRNQWLRRDMQSGRAGLGIILALTERTAKYGHLRHQLWTWRQRAWALLKPSALRARIGKF